MIKDLLKKIGIGLSQAEKNKKRLKILLIEMLKLAKNGDLEGVRRIHQSFQLLMREVFGKVGEGRKIIQEEMNCDLARNNVTNSFTSSLSEKERQEFLERAQQYIDLL